MNSLKILLTAVGCPGAHDLIMCLKNNGERDIVIIGTDIEDDVSGRFFVDRFYKISPASEKERYISDLVTICKKESVDIFLPQSSSDVIPVSENLEIFQKEGIRVVLDDYNTIYACDNKGKMYERLGHLDIPVPETRYCTTLKDFESAVLHLGYPEQEVCFKPVHGKGARGFRILSEKDNKLSTLIHEKTENTKFTLNECTGILNEADPFPHLLVSEFLYGEEITYDAYCMNGEVILGFLKTRERIRSGLAMYFRIIENNDLVNASKRIIRELDFNYFINIQFKGGKLMEINPRVSTFLHAPDFNMPYLGLKHFLGECSSEDLKTYGFSDYRRTIRYYAQVNYDCREGTYEKVMKELDWNKE